MPDKRVVTLYEWIGGMSPIERWVEAFYQKVRKDQLLAPAFSGMGPEHPRHVAHSFAEVLGGPSRYSEERGVSAERTL